MPRDKDWISEVRAAERAARPRPLTAADLRWYYGESESAMGVRSTHGAFVDMAQSGPPTGGGKTNGVEARAVEAWRLDAVHRERRIRAALQGVPGHHQAVLAAAHGADNWMRHLPSPIRAAVGSLFGESAHRGADASLVHVAPLTALARTAAARHHHRPAPAGKPIVVTGPLRLAEEDDPAARDTETGVRCAYRPSAAPAGPKPPKGQHAARRPKATAQDAKVDLFQRDPALAGSAHGAVVEVACGKDAARRAALVSEARALLEAAHRAAGIAADPSPPRRIRVSRPEAPPASLLLASEVA